MSFTVLLDYYFSQAAPWLIFYLAFGSEKFYAVMPVYFDLIKYLEVIFLKDRTFGTQFRSYNILEDLIYHSVWNYSQDWIKFIIWNFFNLFSKLLPDQALFRKGVSKDDIKKAIQLVFEGGESDGYKESRHGLSQLSMDRLLVQASKQWLRGNDVPKETRKARIIRWLQYRGFSWDVISMIVKKLESNDPP